MTDLLIPGYQVIIPNRTYGKQTLYQIDNKKEIPVTQLIQWSRFTIPSNEDLIDKIVSATREETSPSSLNRILETFAQQEIKKIQEKNPEVISLLQSYCPILDPETQIGRTYLITIYGIVPDEIIDMNKEILQKGGVELYKRLINTFNKKSWDLSLRLEGKDQLPENTKIREYLEEGVRNCYRFRVKGNYEDKQEILKELERLYQRLYQILDTPEKVNQVEDVTSDILEKGAVETIIQASPYLKTRNQELFEILNERKKDSKCELN